MVFAKRRNLKSGKQKLNVFGQETETRPAREAPSHSKADVLSSGSRVRRRAARRPRAARPLPRRASAAGHVARPPPRRATRPLTVAAAARGRGGELGRVYERSGTTTDAAGRSARRVENDGRAFVKEERNGRAWFKPVFLKLTFVQLSFCFRWTFGATSGSRGHFSRLIWQNLESRSASSIFCVEYSRISLAFAWRRKKPRKPCLKNKFVHRPAKQAIGLF